MHRRYKTAIIVILAGGVIASLALLSRARQPGSDVRPDPAPRGWPADRLFAWSFDVHPEPVEMRLTLEIRSATRTLGEREAPSIAPQASAMPAQQASSQMRTGSVGLPSDWKGDGYALVQLIDLREINAVPATPGEHLRLLGTLRVGGMATDLNEALPPGKAVGYTTVVPGTWRNGELYLMSFYVENDTELTHYDVVLRRAADD